MSISNLLNMMSFNDQPTQINPCYGYGGVMLTAKYPQLEDKLDAISKSPKFKNWVDKIDKNVIRLTEFIVTDCDFFGPVKPDKLGFVKGKGIGIEVKTGKQFASNIAFIRGGSVAVLIIVTIEETREKMIILCKQLRFPVGSELIEACAGMLDDQVEDAKVEGVAFKELREETGFDVKSQDLIKLGKIIPSGGGCDEEISLYAWETSIMESEYNEKLSRVFGEGNESIQLKSYPYESFDDTLDQIKDVKAECCWRRYLRYKYLNIIRV
jgi:8-oxo-dGTP pyrophosphatase MutT (NUDIX family)